MNEKISNLRSEKDQRTQRVIRLFKRFPMVLCKQSYWPLILFNTHAICHLKPLVYQPTHLGQ